MQKNKW